ncbi:MAG: class I SAM-dependent methyltransferase [Bacteroidetes bacterium]|nr:class I SAM-dependent methyltransferase [Bacteroidota bacterium]
MEKEIDYSKYFLRVQESYKCALGKYLSEIEFDFILKHIKSIGRVDIKILDVGGGDGRHAFELVKLGYQVDILEFDDPPINALKEKRYPFKIVKGDGNKLDQYFKNDEYDVVLAIQLEACTDKRHFISFSSVVKAILKKNGLFIFTGTNSFSIFGLLRILSPRSRYPMQFYKVYDRTFFYILKETKKKFQVVDIKGYRYAPVKRFSNNKSIISFFSFLERVLFLNKLPLIAPWILFSVRK